MNIQGVDGIRRMYRLKSILKIEINAKVDVQKLYLLIFLKYMYD